MVPEGILTVERNTSYFSDASLKQIQNAMRIKQYSANDIIFQEEGLLNKLFFVDKGYVKLTKLNEEGKTLIFHYFFPMDLFGEYNGKDERVSPFTARAMEDSRIGIIDYATFKEMIMENNDLMLEFIQWQTHMKRYTQLKLRDLLFHGKDGALASTILRAANTYGVQRENHTFVTRKFTNNDFAEMVGSSRETVNRLLLSFKKEGIISYKNGWIEVLDMPKLKKLCHCEECPISICRL